MQTFETTTSSTNSINAVSVVKYAYRNFPPKTKFRSLFGATDIVSNKDEVRVDKFGECYILCNSGQWRLIYNGKYWADIV
jgi:hypothetical protein